MTIIVGTTSNQAISSNWWKHTYWTHWSGFDPCVKGYQIRMDSDTNAEMNNNGVQTNTATEMTVSSNHANMVLTETDPVKCGYYDDRVLQVYWKDYTDRSWPDPKDTQAITYWIKPACHYSDIYQPKIWPSMDILLQDSLTTTNQYTHRYSGAWAGMDPCRIYIRQTAHAGLTDPAIYTYNEYPSRIILTTTDPYHCGPYIIDIQAYYGIY